MSKSKMSFVVEDDENRITYFKVGALRLALPALKKIAEEGEILVQQNGCRIPRTGYLFTELQKVHDRGLIQMIKDGVDADTAKLIIELAHRDALREEEGLPSLPMFKISNHCCPGKIT